MKYPREDLFKARLIKKYGLEVIQDFEQTLHSTETNLIDISKKYGFTKMRASQIAAELFGKGTYIKLRKQLRKSIELHNRNVNNHPSVKATKVKSPSAVAKGFKTEEMVYNKLKSLGYKVSYPLYQSPYDLKIENKLIEVKGCHKSIRTSHRAHTKYCLANLTYNERRCADFVIIYIEETKEFYIIPKKAFKGRAIYIRTTPKEKMSVRASTSSPRACSGDI